jgi:hypothetical protein
MIQDALKKPWIEPPPLPSTRVPEAKAAEKIPA